MKKKVKTLKNVNFTVLTLKHLSKIRGGEDSASGGDHGTSGGGVNHND